MFNAANRSGQAAKGAGVIMVCLTDELLPRTARQYGEVVLPDASTGQSPGTIARKLSRCKEGMAHFLPSGYKFY